MKARVRAIAVAFILAAACSGGGTGPDDGGNGGNNNGGNNNGGGGALPNTITVGAVTFSPNLTIAVGTKVTWVSESASPHTITPENAGQPGVWQAVEFNRTGTVLEHTFNTAGQVYRYRCVLHSSSFTAGMVGTITVQA